MPLQGIVDPTHDERNADMPGRLPEWFKVEELLARAATADAKWSPWPYELLAAAIMEHQERDYISTTMLVGGCSRSKVLERREDYIATLDSMYAALRGTQIHRTLEYTARDGALAEARFWTSFYVPGVKLPVEVSCSPDLVGPLGLSDYKVTENPPTFGHPWRNHTQQVNLNRYIVNHAERWEMPDGVELPWDPRTLRIPELSLVYLGPKGPKVIVCTKAQDIQYKNGNTGRKQLPYVWSDDEVFDCLMPRLIAMVKALAAYPEWPWAEDEDLTGTGFEGPEGWACPGKPWCSLPDCLAKRYPSGLTW